MSRGLEIVTGGKKERAAAIETIKEEIKLNKGKIKYLELLRFTMRHNCLCRRTAEILLEDLIFERTLQRNKEEIAFGAAYQAEQIKK